MKHSSIKFKDCYAIVCSDENFAPKSKKNRMICGIYASKKEAGEAEKDIGGCVCKHTIVKGTAIFKT